jgi:hypothetical protein
MEIRFEEKLNYIPFFFSPNKAQIFKHKLLQLSNKKTDSLLQRKHSHSNAPLKYQFRYANMTTNYISKHPSDVLLQRIQHDLHSNGREISRRRKDVARPWRTRWSRGKKGGRRQNCVSMHSSCCGESKLKVIWWKISAAREEMQWNRLIKEALSSSHTT